MTLCKFKKTQKRREKPVIFSDTSIQIIDVDSGKARSLVPDNRVGNIDPAWSPDGKQIAFVSNRSGSPEIWIIGVDGSGLRVLTESFEFLRFPVWTQISQ